MSEFLGINKLLKWQYLLVYLEPTKIAQPENPTNLCSGCIMHQVSPKLMTLMVFLMQRSKVPSMARLEHRTFLVRAWNPTPRPTVIIMYRKRFIRDCIKVFLCYKTTVSLL